MTTVTMSRTGRITLPAEARRSLGVEGETQFEVEVDQETGTLILHPAILVRRRDAWALTPEHQAMLQRAHGDVDAGRLRRISEEELRALGE